MTRSRITAQADDVGARPDTTELLGSAVDPRLLSQRPLAPATARRVLAQMLGVDARELAAITPEALDAIVQRLRSLLAQSQRLAAAATVDDLTGALRRGAGMATLERELARTGRTQGSVVVAFIDVDSLKQVNDRHGHGAGDRLLRDVVAAMRARVRRYDLIFRYGGDEFVCALIDVGEEQARRTLEEVRAHFAERSAGHAFSVGFAQSREGDSAESIVQRADEALYTVRSQSAQRSAHELDRR